MQNIDLMLMHAQRQLIVKRVAQAIGDRRELLLSDQVVVDAVLLVKRVIIHAQLCCNKIGDGLSMLARDN